LADNLGPPRRRTLPIYNESLMVQRAAVILVFLLCVSALEAQRLFKTIDLTEYDESLIIDVNLSPVSSLVVETPIVDGSAQDFNFAPNIIFSPDGAKAFLAIPGTDKIVVFGPDSGDILDLVEVGNNPAQGALSPDGEKVIFACLELTRNVYTREHPFGELVGSIVSIDIDTLEVESLELREVFISFVSNLAFSADGSTGYITSTATDELIRFDVATLTEITPRLKFTPGTRPTSIQAFPDGSLLSVVLVGSDGLDRIQTPDSIALVDLESFSVVKSLIPPSIRQDEIRVHDFSASTTVAISHNGKYLLISDQIVTSNLPRGSRILANDRAWLFNLENDEVQLFFTGSVAMGAHPTASGKFVVICEFEIDFIDPEASQLRRLLPPANFSGFRPRSVPAFSADGKWMFLASPLSDRLLRVNLETTEIPTVVEIADGITRGEEGQEVELASAPLLLAFSPSGNTLLAVNFNENSIGMIRDTSFLYLPRSASDEQFYTGVALTNLSAETAEVIVTGLTNTGILYADDDETEDVVEFVNPRTLEIEPGQQLALTTPELIEASETVIEEGWFSFDTDQPDLKSFFLIGDRAFKRLDGTVTPRGTSQLWVLPVVQVEDGMETEVTVLNPNRQSFGYRLTLVNKDGTTAATFTGQLAPRTLRTAPLRDIDDDDDVDRGFFNEDVWEEFEGGYVVVETDVGVVAFERYWDDQRMASLAGIPLSIRDEQYSTLYLPQVSHFGGAESYITLVNANPPVEEEEEEEGEEGEEEEGPEEIPIKVVLSLKDNEGADLAAPVTIDLPAGTSQSLSLAELFGLQDPGGPMDGWVQAEVDNTGFAGAGEIRLFDGRAMTTLPFAGELRTDMIFSHVAQGLGLSTGIALINPGQEVAHVQLEVFDTEGVSTGSVEFQLQAGERVSQLLSEYIEAFGEQVGGYIRVSSSQPLVGIELFFADNLELVSAVGAQ
jgi:DNA-binding beta-propeller fold protein YncE